jgi:hypothetical protein
MTPATSPGAIHAPPAKRRRPLKIAVVLSAEENPIWVARLEAEGHRVLSVEAEDLPERLADLHVDVVMARVLPGADELRRSSLMPAFFYVGRFEMQDLSSITHELRFTVVADLDEACAQLQNVASPERKHPRFPPAKAITVRTKDSSVTWPLQDLSNEGLSFRVPFGAGVDAFTRDAQLQTLVLEADGQPILTVPGARVRNLSADEDGYQVGCELLVPVEFNGVRQRVFSHSFVGVLLRRGASRRINIRQLDSPGATCVAELQSVDVSEGTLELEAETRALRTHDVVECHFEVGGATYWFHSVVLGHAPLRLNLPRTLSQSERRSTGRLAASEEIRLEFFQPITGQVVNLAVSDISSRGLSFEFDPRTTCFPRGLKLHELRLKVGDDVVLATGEVRGLQLLEPHRQRCGIRLISLDASAQACLGNLWIRLRMPQQHTYDEQQFSQLWDFFRETHLIGDSTAQWLKPSMEAIEQTYKLLAEGRSRVSQTTTVRDDNRIVAHVSAIMLFRNTWYIQHLSARRTSTGLALLLNRAFAEFLEQHPNISVVRLTYRFLNEWPARVFGGFARRIEAPDFSVLQALQVLSLPADFKPPAEVHNTGVKVRVATVNDLIWAEAFFTSVEPSLLWQANDLNAQHLELKEVSEAYKQVGLERTRTVFIATLGNRRVGVALAELSSAGINLRESFSGLRQWTTKGLSGSEQVAVAAALLVTATEFYKSHGRATVHLFADVAAMPLYQSLGLKGGTEAREWTFRREALPAFIDYISHILEELPGR